MGVERSDREKDLSGSEETEDREEKLSEKSSFFLTKEDKRKSSEKDHRKERKTNKGKDRSTVFFIPGEDVEVKGRL